MSKIVKVEMYLELDDAGLENIRKVTHHAEYLLDLDAWPEIKSVYGVKVEEQEG